jgi:aminoglycoside phosphotransferase (APT) family kinase protein
VDRDVSDPAAGPVRPGDDLDWPRIEGWLRSQVAGLPDAAMTVQQFPHGKANMTYLVTLGERRLVLRRPPFGTIAPGAHDMRREYAVLSRLWRSYDRAPRAFALCTDHDVAGADLVVMEHRTGVVIGETVPPALAAHPDLGRRVGAATVEALADLHLVDPAAAGLQDLGRPDGFLRRQVDGWTKRWGLAAPRNRAPEMDDVAERLRESLPDSARPSVLHNDFKLDNGQFDPEDPDRMVSVFDWDMATLGDPLVDLGILLGYWPDADDPEEIRGAVPSPPDLGLPGRRVVVDRYAARTGLDLGRIGWYQAFARWKTAVVYQQLANRALRGESNDPRLARYAERVPAFARHALRLLERTDTFA